MERDESRQVRRHLGVSRGDRMNVQTSVSHNLDCKSDAHSRHLCYMVALGFHLSDEHYYQALTDKPKYKCECCGRVAKHAKNLCRPVGLQKDRSEGPAVTNRK